MSFHTTGTRSRTSSHVSRTSSHVSRTSSYVSSTTSSKRNSFAKRSHKKPLIIGCTSIVAGHVGPTFAMLKGLIDSGYEVIVVAGTCWKQKAEAMGARLAPVQGVANQSEEELISKLPLTPEGTPDFRHLATDLFLYPMIEQYAAVRRVLQDHAEEQAAGRALVVVAEFMFPGLYPFYCDVPSPNKPTGIITLGCSPVMERIAGTTGGVPRHEPGSPAPVPAHHKLTGDPPPPGTDAAAMAGHVTLFDFADEHTARVVLLKSLGCTKAPLIGFDDAYKTADRFLQLSVPSLEREHPGYPIKFAGVAPMHLADASEVQLPDWWPQLKEKKVALVTQGTVNPDYSELIIPTLQALKSNPDVLVVALLGRRGASLPPDVEIPANARVIDYFPYHLVLKEASLFVTNADYGGVQQSLMFGVPMVLASIAQDKVLVAHRMAEAGAGIDLETQRPTEEQIAKAVDTILATDSYAKRCLEIGEEIKQYDPVKILVDTLREIVIEKKMKQEEEEGW